MTDKEQEFADYNPDEWLGIFKESMTEEYEERSPFEFVANEILNMANYANWPDLYYGFMFMETLRYVYKPIHHTEYPFAPKNIDLDEFLITEFETHYLAIVHMDPLRSLLDWGTSIRGAWLSYFEIERLKKYNPKYCLELGCGFVKNGHQILPQITTQDQHKKFFTALIMWFDEIVGELGPDKYKAIQELYYKGNLNLLKDPSMFFPEEKAS